MGLSLRTVVYISSWRMVCPYSRAGAQGVDIDELEVRVFL